MATHLINALKSEKALDQNYVKSVLGHGQFKTTEEIYGSHVFEATPKERAARRAAVSRALKLNPITKLLKN